MRGCGVNIELKLWGDQSEANLIDTNSTVWEMFFNGSPFPDSECNLVTLRQAHEFANKLMDMEEAVSE